MFLTVFAVGCFVVAVASKVYDAVKPTPRRAPAPPSPIPGISAAAYGDWQRANITSDAERQAHADRSPLYGLRAREYADVGLADGSDEHEAFQRVSRQLAARILRAHAATVGEPLEGAPASLSGLMAAARAAGLGGLKSWCASAEERARFSDTTTAYNRANGIF